MTVLNIIYNLLSLIFVFFAIGFCIFSHELGHFLAAKWRGLHIDAFSLGFKPFWRKKINGVEYRLGWLPFGGYVELPQVDATEATPHAADGTELPRAKPLDRIITAVAGPLFNILSGLLIACIVWVAGMPQDSPKMREIPVYSIVEDSPEYRAGLRADDVIVKLNGKSIFSTWSQFVSAILFTIGEVELEVQRDGQNHTVTYIPIDNPNAPGSLKNEGIAWPFFTPLVPIELRPKAGSVAEAAGIRPGDYAVTVNGKHIADFAEFQDAIDQAGGGEAVLGIRRGKEDLFITLTPVVEPEAPAEATRYLTGIIMSDQSGTVKITSVTPNMPAVLAGLQSGDQLIRLDETPITSAGQVQNLIREKRETPFDLVVRRNGETHTIHLAARKITPHTIGVQLASMDHPTPFQQFWYVVDMSYRSLVGITVGLGNQLGLTEQTSSLKPSHMSGPLGMGMVLFVSVRKASIISGIFFMVIISFALAIFNLFPLPVLDGGHITFGLIEIIFRRPLPTFVIRYLSMIFVVLLIGLMVYVTFSDGRRLWRNLAPISNRAIPNAETLPVDLVTGEAADELETGAADADSTS